MPSVSPPVLPVSPSVSPLCAALNQFLPVNFKLVSLFSCYSQLGRKEDYQISFLNSSKSLKVGSLKLRRFLGFRFQSKSVTLSCSQLNSQFENSIEPQRIYLFIIKDVEHKLHREEVQSPTYDVIFCCVSFITVVF